METNPISQRIRDIANGGRLPQAVLVEGQNISFRDASADFLAAAVVCTGEVKPCGVCRDCRKAFAGIHPDVVTVNTDDKEKYIKVDRIRQIRTDAYIRPNEAENRVFLIKNADFMKEEAQNALLKLLEEPPDTVALILTAASRSRLLPTIRSRLMQINVDGECARPETLQDPASRELFTYVCEKNAYRILAKLHLVTADRISAAVIFADVRAALTETLSCKKGVEGSYSQAVIQAATALTAEQLLCLTEWCDGAVSRVNANANKVLLAVSLSAEINQILGI